MSKRKVLKCNKIVHLFTERANHTSRQKSVILQVYNHATIASTWYVFLLTAGAMATVISSFTALSIRMIRRYVCSFTAFLIEKEADE